MLYMVNLLVVLLTPLLYAMGSTIPDSIQAIFRFALLLAPTILLVHHGSIMWNTLSEGESSVVKILLGLLFLIIPLLITDASSAILILTTKFAGIPIRLVGMSTLGLLEIAALARYYG